MLIQNRIVAGFVVIVFLLMVVSPSVAQQIEKEEIVICPKCGAELPISARFCTKCGAELQEPDTSLGPKEEIPEVPPPIVGEEPAIEPEPEAEIMAPEEEEAVPEPSEEIRAESLYDHGTSLFERGEYRLAATTFGKVVKDYPSTKYAEAASLMIEACYRMDMVERGQASRPGKKASDGSVLGDAFVGGCLGVGAAILALLLLARSWD
jgi:ribosomal protein L40E